MQKRSLIFLLFLLMLVGAGYVVVSYSLTPVVSPLPDKKYAIIPTPTIEPTSTPSPTPTPTPTPIPTPTPTPFPVSAPSSLEPIFLKYSDEYSLSNDLLKRIAKCESGFNPDASTGRYAGLFQFTEALWTQTRSLIGLNPDPGLRFNAEESIRTAAFMLSQNHLGIWPNCSK